MFSTTATTASPVGTYAITADVSASPGVLANYSITGNDGTLSITKAPLTVTAADKTKVYGDANPPLTVSTAGSS